MVHCKIFSTIFVYVILVQMCEGLWYHFLTGQPESEDKIIFMDKVVSPDGTEQRFETRYSGTSCYKVGPIQLKMDITRPKTFKKFLNKCHMSDLKLMHKNSPTEPYQIVKVDNKNFYNTTDGGCVPSVETHYVVLLQTKTPADETLLQIHNDLLGMGITILPKNNLSVCQPKRK
ncbi:uncharacterized protein LOC128173131 [Crassostrea angulata]|uniref:uncharacterized protein LOC128173131 n=1 Tax=Magallana angulata TaxID=2784310 RepID=UPI0022B098C4|nr:uncharacterized protein LOC128173131 [Crassostrea angulata]